MTANLIVSAPMAPERIDEMQKLMKRLCACGTVGRITLALHTELKTDQDRFDLCTFHLHQRRVSHGFIGHLLFNMHSEHVSIVSALKQLKCESINIFDHAKVISDTTRHILFDVIIDGEHRANTSAVKYLCSEMSAFNFDLGQYNLFSYALEYKAYAMLEIMINNGMDMTYKDGLGMCGNDYLMPEDGKYRIRLSDIRAKEIQALLLTRELNLGNPPYANRRAPARGL